MSTLFRDFMEMCVDAGLFEPFKVDALRDELVARGIDTTGMDRAALVNMIVSHNRQMLAFAPPQPDSASPVHVTVTTPPDLSHTIPVYSGQEGEAAQHFIDSIHRVAQQTGWTDETKTSVAVSKLSGIAKSWQIYEGRAHNTWTDWLSAFKVRFDRPLTLREWHNKITECTQRRDETLLQYCSYKLEQMARMPAGVSVSFEEQLDYILS